MKKKVNCPEREYYHALFRGNKVSFAAMLLTMAAGGLANPFFSWLLGEVTDSAANRSMEQLTRTAQIFVVVFPAFILAFYLSDYAKAKFIRRASSQYKELAFERLSRKSISAFSEESTARYLSVLTNDVNTLELQGLENLGYLVQSICTACVAVAMMLCYNWFLALLTIGGSILPILVSVIMGNRYAAHEKRVSDQNEAHMGRIKDLLQGFSVLKSFKAEEQAKQLYHEDNEKLEARKEAKRKYQAAINAAGNAAGMFLQIAIFLIGAYLSLRGTITVGTVMVFVNLSGNVITAIEQVPGYWAGIRASRELVRKLADLNEENIQHTGISIEPKLQDAISFENVSFAYDEGKPVLKEITARFEAGKKYAIVGGSGSGKTTLLNLLMGGCRGYSGSLTIDGKELSNVDPDSLYDLLSLIGQNVFLFDDTIRQNITMFRSFPEREVASAADRSGLAEVITAKGEDYRCGENGAGLSGGERQRVSIARALLRQTPVLMLDEATAALDNQTAFEVTDAILKLEGLTRIVVTHRLEPALLQQYDEILVLREGCITERGTYRELMDKTGYFYSLYHVSSGM